jgi:hypothetical protein
MSPFWGLFAVLVGTFLPISVTLRAGAQLVHDRRLGLGHPVNTYRCIKIALIIPVLAVIAPAGFFLMFGLGDGDMAERIVTFLTSLRGIVVVCGLVVAVLTIDYARPRLIEQLLRQPISRRHRTRIQFRHDTMIVLILMGLALAAAPFL